MSAIDRFVVPAFLKIGPYEYKVQVEKNLILLANGNFRTDTTPLRTDLGESECYGFCQHNPQRILLNEGLTITAERLAAILLHEALHAIEDTYQLTLEEDTVTRLTTA